MKMPEELSNLDKPRVGKRQRQAFNPGLTASKPALLTLCPTATG